MLIPTKCRLKGLFMSADKLVVGLTGMPGSGKSLVVKTAKLKDYEVKNLNEVSMVISRDSIKNHKNKK